MRMFRKFITYFLLNPNRDLIAFIAFSLINDSSNFFMSGSNSSDALTFARSGIVRILCDTSIHSIKNMPNILQTQGITPSSWSITLKSSNPASRASSRAERPACTCRAMHEHQVREYGRLNAYQILLD